MRKIVLIIVAFYVLLECQKSMAQQFQIIGGIPRLPVFANTGSVSSPAAGMLIYSTADAKPMLYTGSAWSDLCSNSVTATTESYFVVKGGIPYIPAKGNIASDPNPGAMYYSTDDYAIMVGNGTSWEKLRLIGNNTFSTNSSFSTSSSLDVALIPVLSSAPTGAAGAIYINSGTKKLNYYNSAWTALSCPVTCGDDLVKVHTFGDGVTAGIAGDVYTITYKTVSTNLAGPNASTYKCWITQNLGAASQASSATDNTTASRGWFWQFNKPQGHKNANLEGSGANTPLFTYTNINENSSWTLANDPCALLLGTGWRLPTSTEWTYADGTSGGNWASAANTYSSVLKIHMAGYILLDLSSTTQALTGTGTVGRFFSSTQVSTTNGYYLGITAGTSAVASQVKYHGYALRCLMD